MDITPNNNYVLSNFFLNAAHFSTRNCQMEEAQLISQ